MIVAAIDVENYKQYAGVHRIEFPEQGIVAITGPNGAGKTTLFEAIEWCLYCPRSIPQSSVPPHDGVGRTIVRVTLEDSNDGKRYCVQRELRANGTQAEIYLEDDPGQPVVQGTREVTRYVARHLVGLPHGAFVSTFFTKQRELQFFGDRSATERRTEIGKLLGLEAVREAQSEIGDGRNAARSLADARRREHERRLGTRDLEAEEAKAARVVTEAEAEESDAEQAALTSSIEAERASEVLDKLRDLKGRDAELGQVLAELTGEISTATARRDGAVAQLNRLEMRSAERMQLAVAADAIDGLAECVERMENDREQARRLQALQESHRRALDAERAVASRLEQVVADHRDAAEGLSCWEWSPRDAADCGAGADRLRAIALSLYPDIPRTRFERMQEAWRQSISAVEISATLARFKAQRNKLSHERDALLGFGEPNTAVEEAGATLRELREVEHKARMSLAAARTQHAADEKLVTILREHSQESVCPTCSRPLGPAEAARLISLVEARITVHIADERFLTDTASDARRLVEAAEQAESLARARLEAVKTLESRIFDGDRMIEEAGGRHGEVTAALQTALEAIGAASAPTKDEIDAARLDTERTQRIAGLAGLLDRLHLEAVTSRQAQVDAKERMGELGEAAFDEAAFDDARDALNKARDASAQVLQIDVEIAHRDQYQELRTRQDGEIKMFEARRAAIATERTELAFESVALKSADVTEKAARIAAVEARDHHAAARQAVRDAQLARERLNVDHQQLQELVEESDSKTREADELTRMYDEFGEFDRYVARHVGPLLAETTERMMSQVTNGKFDHVMFDENYGIDVFDGDEAFPIANFSGGERDVVALCARLALSEVVGSAAVRPPRFLVLDEVFGSLDGERRNQLLETLGGLAHAGHFRQMFIISHVDDVQQSPVMTEAWTIEEREGVSRVVRPDHFNIRS